MADMHFVAVKMRLLDAEKMRLLELTTKIGMESIKQISRIIGRRLRR